MKRVKAATDTEEIFETISDIMAEIGGAETIVQSIKALGDDGIYKLVNSLDSDDVQDAFDSIIEDLDDASAQKLIGTLVKNNNLEIV